MDNRVFCDRSQSESPAQQLTLSRSLVARKPFSELWIAGKASANSEGVGHETEGEVNNGNGVDSSFKDAEELENYMDIREELYKKAKDFDSTKKLLLFPTF